MAKVILYCADVVGKSMAGPAIRYWEMAKILSKIHKVILLTPNLSEISSPDFEIISYTNSLPVNVFQNADVIITQVMTFSLLQLAQKHNIKIIFDAYTPIFFEAQEIFRSKPLKYRSLMSALLVKKTNLFFRSADGIICATGKQRDLWMGTLMSLNLIKPCRYDQDTTFRSFIDVVPFGLPSQPPQLQDSKLKKKFSLKATDKVILWGGGIWNWFDPLSLIRAMKILSDERDDIKLVFMGMTHPNKDVPEMEMTQKALQLSTKLKLINHSVFFNHDWVPYEERQSYLLEANIGASIHFEDLETSYAFRTRILDYIWAELPILTTEGDTFAELVKSHNLGVVVPYGDEKAIANGILQIIDHPLTIKEIKNNLAELKKTLTWEQMIRPLSKMIDSISTVSLPNVKALWLPSEYFKIYLAQVRLYLPEYGVFGLTKKILKKIFSRL
jgi:glycosyltransferase involved in cell wall biosynthesis